MYHYDQSQDLYFNINFIILKYYYPVSNHARKKQYISRLEKVENILIKILLF